MANSLVEAYADLIARLLPKGHAWDRVREWAGLRGLATELCRIDERGLVLLEQIDPLTSTEMLEDWEQLLALPDDCSPAAQTI